MIDDQHFSFNYPYHFRDSCKFFQIFDLDILCKQSVDNMCLSWLIYCRCSLCLYDSTNLRYCRHTCAFLDSCHFLWWAIKKEASITIIIKNFQFNNVNFSKMPFLWNHISPLSSSVLSPLIRMSEQVTKCSEVLMPAHWM